MAERYPCSTYGDEDCRANYGIRLAWPTSGDSHRLTETQPQERQKRKGLGKLKPKGNA